MGHQRMLDKQRLVAISKSDMLDEELISEMDALLKEDFPDIDYIFISSVAQKGIQELKDRLWMLLDE